MAWALLHIVTMWRARLLAATTLIVVACGTTAEKSDDDDGSPSGSTAGTQAGSGGGAQVSSSASSASTAASQGAGGDGAQGSGGGSCYAGNGECDPLGPSTCPSGYTCSLTFDDEWGCFPNGSAEVGEACNVDSGDPLCVHGALCVLVETQQCFMLCCSPDDCFADETCSVLGGLNIAVGVCAPN
jgi:hypothetical protein